MNNQPAFPVSLPHLPVDSRAGMTLRDYFAAKALQGFCAREGYDYPDAVTDAYKTADAMLKAREESCGQ